MNWEQIYQNELFIETLISFGIFLLFLLLRKIFTKYLFKFILKITKKSPTSFFTKVWLAFEKPIDWLFVVIGFYIAAVFFPWINQHSEGFLDFYRSSIVILIAWGFFNLSSTSSILFNNLNKKLNLQIDQILIPFLSKLLRVVIVLIAVTIIIDELGYNIGTLVAGLGIGGLAVSLAAQDALKNFIGGTILIFERPFNIGDWIKTPTVEGTVEEISFRSTLVRTFDQALVTVPNATLSTDNIINWSKMGKRRVNFNLGIALNTPPERIERAVEKLRDMLKNHPDVHPETIFVHFDAFKDNRLELMLYFFTNTTVWGEYLSVKEDINLKIIEILHEEKVEIPYPTQKLYVETAAEDSKQKTIVRDGQ